MKALIARILEETAAERNPFFVNLKSGDFSREDFVETQLQFYHAVTFFVRPMAALAAKIPTPELRIEVIRNIWEEHGEGDPERMHGATFREFLARLGDVGPAELEKRALSPSIRIFNTTLSGACVLDEYLIGAATLGMIERMFCDISNWIAQGVVERGWLTADRMIHYNLHKELDVKHSEDFFEVLQPAWNRSAEDRYVIEQGFRMGAALFNGLYENLYRERRQRPVRGVSGPHHRG